MVQDDINQQVNVMTSQLTALQRQEESQSEIERELERIHHETIKDLEQQYTASVAERDELALELAELRKQHQAQQAQNTEVADKNRLLDLELERLEEYSTQLQRNVDQTVDTYNSQFSQLCSLISDNNEELVKLRDQSSRAETDYYNLAIQNDVLDAKVKGLSFEHEMRLIEDSEHKLHML